VLHLPLVLWAGLGELSRIGELVLHPFLGPRSKSVVVTTDMPLALDRPIDFGLQDTCSKCRKCARECPCNAISYKPTVMFNGYEMWKPDVERCTRYRVTNPKGSSCGRCMKVCPFANEGLLTHRILLWCAVHLPFIRRWLVRLDDLVRHGERNPVKKWWRDLERRDDGTVHEPWGANARDLDLARRRIMEKRQDIAYYPAGVMPPPNAREPHPIDRSAALAAAGKMETPIDALRRRQRSHPGPPKTGDLP
jgi:ferredoxin